MARKRRQVTINEDHEMSFKKVKIINDEIRIKNILKIQSWLPNESNKMTQCEMKINDSLDDSLFSALAEYSKSQGNLDNVDATIVTKIRQHLIDFATRPSVKKKRSPIKDSVWSHYCHHIYIQHQKVVRDLRNCDLDSNEDNEIGDHAMAKEAYRKYMLKTPGSLLEVFLASMRYDLNAQVVQHIEKTNKIFIYNINPHFTNKIYLINIGEPDRGKWRHLEPKNPQSFPPSSHDINLDKLNQPTLQVGVYTILKEDFECDTLHSILHIEQSVKLKAHDRMMAVTCDLAVFNRLLEGVATIEEFTVCMENPESQGNYKIPHSIQSKTKVSQLPQYELKQLFKARSPPMESNSVCPFQSMENIRQGLNMNVDTQQQEAQHAYYSFFNNITNKLHNLGQNVNERSSSCSLHKFTQSPNQISREFDCQNENSRRGIDLDSFLLKNFYFTIVKNNPMIQTAVIVGAEFGSPQILIRLEMGAKLTYESHTIMYMMILNKAGICLQFYDFQNNQWLPSQFKSEAFTIDPKTCFRFHNTAKDVVYIRCSWFSPPVKT